MNTRKKREPGGDRNELARTLARRGHSNRAIAAELGVSEATVSRALRGRFARPSARLEQQLAQASALTPAERAVSALALVGHTNRGIADRRRTATRTVANQLASVYAKLEVDSRRQLRARLLGADRKTRGRKE